MTREEIREGLEGILTDCWQEAVRTRGYIRSGLERDYAGQILAYLHSKGVVILKMQNVSTDPNGCLCITTWEPLIE